MKRVWLLAYLCGIVLAVLSQSGAPLVLAIGLPGAFLLLPAMREERAIASWNLFLVAGALGFWRLTQGGSPWEVQMLLGLTVLMGVPFIGWVLGNRSLGIPLALIAVFAMLVGYFSSGRGGPDFIEHWLLSQGLSADQAHHFNIAFRKTVHFTFYGSVALTSLIASLRASNDLKASLRTALLAALALASFDELRQSGFAQRTGSAWDVLLDMAGGLTFVGLSRWIVSRRR